MSLQAAIDMSQQFHDLPAKSISICVVHFKRSTCKAIDCAACRLKMSIELAEAIDQCGNFAAAFEQVVKEGSSHGLFRLCKCREACLVSCGPIRAFQLLQDSWNKPL